MKDPSKYTDMMLSSWLCLGHWNEMANHQPEHEYLVKLLDEEAARQSRPILTIAELKERIGRPVWVETPGVRKYGRWVIVEDAVDNALICRRDFTCHDYGKSWVAYDYEPYTPVEYGEWIKVGKLVKCSKCGNPAIYTNTGRLNTTPHCSLCGRPMKSAGYRVILDELVN